MGIDVYTYWTGMTKAEADAQMGGFDITIGATGYLREAYHGGPYATRVLLPPRYWEHEGEVSIGPNPMWPDEQMSGVPVRAADLEELKARLPAAVMVSVYRQHRLYEQGEHPGVGGNDVNILDALSKVFARMGAQDSEELASKITPEQIRQTKQAIAEGRYDYPAKSFIEFVALAEAKLGEGKEVVIFISH